jgi:hypothetical protein
MELHRFLTARWPAGRPVSKLWVLISEQKLRLGVGRADVIRLSPRTGQRRTGHKDDFLWFERGSGNIRFDRLPEAIRRKWQTDWPMIKTGRGASFSDRDNERTAMHNQPDRIREAVGVFASESDLQAAIDELLSSGFHRAELSLLASEDAVKAKLGSFANIRDVEDDPAVPRAPYVSPEAIGDAQGGIVSGLVYAGATAAAGTVLVSGGTIVAALVAATLVGGAGGIVGALLAKWLGDNHARYVRTQVDHGGLLLWVRTRDANAEDRAVGILKRHSSRDVHVHALSPKAMAIELG